MENKLSNIKSFLSHFASNTAKTVKFLAKTAATGTVILPLAIGIRELYKGYSIDSEIYKDYNYLNTHRRFNRYSDTENSKILKIRRSVNPILGLKVGINTVWSGTSYHDLSNAPVEELKKVPLDKLPMEKLYFLLSRREFVRNIDTEQMDKICKRSIHLRNTTVQDLDLNRLDVLKICKNYQLRWALSEEQIKNYLSKDNPNFTQLSPREKGKIIKHFGYHQRDLGYFLHDLNLQEIIDYRIYKYEHLFGGLTEDQIKELLTSGQGTGLTPEIIDYIGSLESIDIDSLRFTKENDDGSFETVDFHDWLNALKSTPKGYAQFLKFSDEQIIELYKNIQGKGNRRAFKNNIIRTFDKSFYSYRCDNLYRLFNNISFNEYDYKDSVHEKSIPEDVRNAARRLGITDIEGPWKPIRKAYLKEAVKYKSVRQNVDSNKADLEKLKQINNDFDLIKKYRGK